MTQLRAYTGRTLLVDLSTRTSHVEEIDRAYLKDYLGGAGLATRLLYDRLKPGTEPLSPENVLVFAAGALTGTMVPTSGKHAVATRSPLTGWLGDSLSGSFWAIALKRAGYDALIVTGEADRLTYLFVDDGIVRFRDASALKGVDALTTQRQIRQELGDSAIRVAAIGPAGENLVRYASLANDGSRQAGRTGIGAVMGSKKLKAIAIRGTGSVQVADLPELEKACLALYSTSQGPSTVKYRGLGTLGNVSTLDKLGVLPTRNFRTTTFEGAEKVSGEYIAENYKARVVACAGCSIGCEHVFAVPGETPGASPVRMDYETLYALGPLCGIDDFPTIVQAAGLCDAYGLDSISAGVSVAWAMECYERGLLTQSDTEGMDLRFGQTPALLWAIERITRREGLGDLLAEGTKRASEELGQGSEHWAMHAKGLELPGYDPRSLKTLALGYAVGTRGGCHNRSAAYEVDMSGKVDRFKGERGRGRMAADQEDFAAILDSLMLCKFLRRCFGDFYAEASRLYTLATGLDLTSDQLRRVGDRVCNLKKAFNIREGWKRADDWLPPRVFRDPIPEGAAEGIVLTEEELEIMLDDYYQARGWTVEGLIPAEKLRELGLVDLVLL